MVVCCISYEQLFCERVCVIKIRNKIMDNEKISSWVEEALGTKINSIIHEDASEEKQQGFMADILFVNVETNKTVKDEREIHLAIKTGKNNIEVRQEWPMISAAYQREIFFYNKVLPQFETFLKEKNKPDESVFTPKCYKTFLNDYEEVIIMENLKSKGYRIHSRKSPMDIGHIKIIFKMLAKFHATSMAIRNENNETYNCLTSHYESVLIINSMKNKASYEKIVEKVINVLKDVNKENLADQFKKLVEKGVMDIFEDILINVPKENVIIHGDSHNNNFLFKYEGEDKSIPTDMLMIDFQLSCVHSPVLDLAYCWYFCSSKEIYSSFVYLIEYYHYELSKFLSQLGTDSEIVFPLETLWKHWKQYSPFGLIMATLFMDLLIVEEKTEVTELKKNDKYVTRISDGLEHFFSFKINI